MRPGYSIRLELAAENSAPLSPRACAQRMPVAEPIELPTNLSSTGNFVEVRLGGGCSRSDTPIPTRRMAAVSPSPLTAAQILVRESPESFAINKGFAQKYKNADTISAHAAAE